MSSKPMSLTDKEYLIRMLAIQLATNEKTIEAVVNHQFQSANEAMDINKSIEISGFGKWMFNEKKGARKLKTYYIKRWDMYSIIHHPTATAEQIRKATLIYNEMVENIALLKPAISDEFLTDLRGMEEQFDSVFTTQTDDKGSL